MIRKAYAKINLQLNVVNKRSDNYHNLQMINCRIEMCDIIKVVENQKMCDQLYFTNNDLLSDKDDLVLRVLQEYKKRHQITKCFDIMIEKHIPVGAGLGGGSMDASTTILMIQEYLGLHDSVEELIELTIKYGADIGYGFYNAPAIVSGVGDIIESLNDFPLQEVIVIYPNIVIKTADVFKLAKCRNCELSKSEITKIINSRTFTNDLEQSAFIIEPVLKQLKSSLSEYGNVVMSGSGSTMVLLPTDDIYITKQKLQARYPQYLIVNTKIIKEI